MKIFSNPQTIQKSIKNLKLKKQTIGFVPTMGALHQGHISLIRRAKKENDIVVVSIFVNPAQFGPKEDLKSYPKPFVKDVKLCKKEGVDIIFAPKPESMYPKNYLTYINVEKLSGTMCGKARPGHFRGVATVVTKLFNIVQPDKAYFGLKDYQQSVIIKKITEDLNYPVKIITCPTIREKSGLALSSRNAYLSKEELNKALSISDSLKKAKELIENKKIKPVKNIVLEIKKIIKPVTDKIDYIEIRDAETLVEIKDNIDRKVVIAIAAYVGKTRLIDNIVVKPR
ncbi:MAG: pantoate--beta-alanine ligase [Elusimicrobia bacterium RIFOXYD2_FULL_34_15]|nr:MAG: pantoate--beta-alanine ligase [Elusimicrobia bacterium RIFOXYD2_FULL_34_15]